MKRISTNLSLSSVLACAALISTGCATTPSVPSFNVSMQPTQEQKIVAVAGSNGENRYLSRSGNSIVSIKKINNSTTSSLESEGFEMWEMEIANGGDSAVKFNPDTDLKVVIDSRARSGNIVKVGYMQDRIASALTPARPTPNMFSALGTSLGSLIASKSAASYAEVQRIQAKKAEMEAQQKQIYEQKLLVWEQQKLNAYKTAQKFTEQELSSKRINPSDRHAGTFLMSEYWHQDWSTEGWKKGDRLNKDIVFQVKVGADTHKFYFKSEAY